MEMIKRIRHWLGLCEHKWNIITRITVYEEGYYKYPKRYDYIMQCAHCSKMKKFKA